MYVEINFLDNVKHDIAKAKILNKLNQKHLTEYHIRYVNRIIDCESGRVSYKEILRFFYIAIKRD